MTATVIGRGKGKWNIWSIALVAPSIALIGLMIVLPVYLVLKSAFNVNGHWTLSEFGVVFTQIPYPKLIFNTLSIAAEVTVACLS